MGTEVKATCAECERLKNTIAALSASVDQQEARVMELSTAIDRSVAIERRMREERDFAVREGVKAKGEEARLRREVDGLTSKVRDLACRAEKERSKRQEASREAYQLRQEVARMTKAATSTPAEPDAMGGE